MDEINTFSAAVDKVVARSGRLERRNDILSYVRLSLREVQTLSLFQKDLVEDRLTADASPFLWTYPSTFRKLWSAQYPSRIDQRGRPVFPRPLQGPTRGMHEMDWYYYPSGDSFVFVGVDPGEYVDIAYLTYFRPLPYLSEASRPARFDLETLEWVYADDVVTADQQLAAQLRVTNWALFNWFDVIIEGALAKLYKTADDPRSVATFALYKQLQNNIVQGEGLLMIDA